MAASKKAVESVEEKLDAGKKEVKKPAARKTAASKKTEDVLVKAAETKEEEVKEQAVEKKAAAVKKPAAKKTAEPEATVTIQFQGKSIAAKDVVEMAKNAFAQANPDVQIKTIDIYVKPEENTAYYAVNGQGSEDYKVEL
ncbi:MAG: hypothetical protein HFG70_01600 [Hungatella sp.]|nr:hypothetical protein [Hungatella sp.]